MEQNNNSHNNNQRAHVSNPRSTWQTAEEAMTNDNQSINTDQIQQTAGTVLLYGGILALFFGVTRQR